jgi:hypothetical protein
VSKNPCLGDIEHRAFIMACAILVTPEEIAALCSAALRLSPENRESIVRRIQREELERLRSGILRSKAPKKRQRAA